MEYIEDFVCRASMPRPATANLQAASKDMEALVGFEFDGSKETVEKYVRYAVVGRG